MNLLLSQFIQEATSGMVSHTLLPTTLFLRFSISFMKMATQGCHCLVRTTQSLILYVNLSSPGWKNFWRDWNWKAVCWASYKADGEIEGSLWDEEIFTCETALGLPNIRFWYSCKFFGLRACDEHRNLEVSQYEIGVDEIGTYLRFKGWFSKNYQGGLKPRRVTPKD